MKKIGITLMVLAFFLTATNSFGQTKTASSAATVSPTPSREQIEINNLKEKIATKVAELNKVNQLAVAGVVTQTSSGEFKIKTSDEQEYTIKVDNLLTKYYSVVTGQKISLKNSDIKKGMYIIVSGPQIDKTITANSIWVDEEFFVLVGKVTQVNKDDLSVTVATSEKDTYTLDVETSTKQQIINIKTLDVEKTGFSKIKEGDTIHFVVKKAQKNRDVNQFSAVRILIIPQEYFLK